MDEPPTFVRAEVTVTAPPPVARRVRTAMLARFAMPAMTLIVGGGMVAALVISDAPAPHSPMFLLFPVMMVGSAIASAAHGGGRQHAAELDADRARYLNYLRALAAQLDTAADTQRDWLHRRYPRPDALWTLVGGPQMWQRRPDGDDFGQVRIGIGSVPAASTPVSPGAEPDDEADPVTWTALRRFLREYSTVPAAPAAIALRGMPAVAIEGDPDEARALARAVLCALAVFHRPTDMAVVAAVSPDTRALWDWLKWLPHNQHHTAHDRVGAVRMVYPTLSAAVAARPRDRYVVVLADGVVGECGEGIAGVTVLAIGATAGAPGGLRVRLAEGQLVANCPNGTQIIARPDRMALGEAIACARRIAQYLPGSDKGEAGGSGWRHLIGLPTAADSANWNSQWDSAVGERLKVPIGTTAGGETLDLDINEAAQRGMGPHGLCVGATGSGKSELLRTVALGMIARHSPAALNLVLVDFKGGATFLGLDRANHVSAIITNLAEEAHLVERMRDALTGEINRRQQILRAAGNLASVTDYDRARRTGRSLPPLPVLFVIIDEFSELLSQQPDFIEVFAAIGRLGRSLGIHLLLASQRLDEGRLRGLDSHLSYRICLKTLSAAESRMTIGVPDAYELPARPGAAYLKVGSTDPIRFQAAFVSGRTDPAPAAPSCSLPTPMLFTAAPVGPVIDTPHTAHESPGGATVVDTVLNSLAGQGPQAHQIWLPPLDDSPTLDAVLGDYQSTDHLVAAIGLADHSFEQRRSTLAAELSGAAGNVAVVGAPQSGKSTVLRTIVTSLALQHDPRRIQFYCLDFGGGGLATLTELPHVGVVAGRRDVDLVRRTVTEVSAVLHDRESSGGANEPTGDVFLVVDGWHALRQEFDGLESAVTAIATEGLSYGVHVVLSASRWADIRPALKDQIGTRIELRLGDPADSEIDRKRARVVPRGRPGHGLTPDGLPFVAALPRIDGVASAEDLDRSAAAVAAMLRARHGHHRAPAIRLLPTSVNHDALLAELTHPTRPLIGLEESRLSPVTIDFERESHLLILGDPQSGKTAALRVLCREILRTSAPSQAQLVLVDPRRSMLGEFDADGVGYLATPAAVAAQLPELVAMLRNRLPGPEITQHQLRTRSWWSGPDLYLVVDDYDLLSTGGGNPLAPLVDLLPHARDIGLHLVLARRSGGAARALYEPVLAAIRELGTMGLQLSGPPDDGPLLGTVRPRPLPPGRGYLMTRVGGDQVVQVAWTAPR
ncbi:type VII secretion protein EccC [soil metagenome]